MLLGAAEGGEEDAREGENGAEEAGGGKMLAEEKIGEDKGDDGNKVQADVGLDGAEELAGAVPGGEAAGAGEKTKEEAVQPVGGGGETGDVARAGDVEEEVTVGWSEENAGEDKGDHEDERIEENAPCRRERRVGATAEKSREKSEKAPDEGGRQSENVTCGMEVEGRDPIEADKGDAENRQSEAEHETPGNRFLFQEKLAGKGRENRADRNDNADVRGVRVVDREILEELIDRDAGKACQCEPELVYSRLDLQSVWANRPEPRVGDEKTKEKNLRGGKVNQQGLGRDESRAPEKDG